MDSSNIRLKLYWFRTIGWILLIIGMILYWTLFHGLIEEYGLDPFLVKPLFKATLFLIPGIVILLFYTVGTSKMVERIGPIYDKAIIKRMRILGSLLMPVGFIPLLASVGNIGKEGLWGVMWLLIPALMVTGPAAYLHWKASSEAKKFRECSELPPLS